METFFFALPTLVEVAILFLLFLFIFSILAVFFFQISAEKFKLYDLDVIDDENNFNNFLNSIMLCFRCSTLQQWFEIMNDTI